jgi:hypothetical protein
LIIKRNQATPTLTNSNLTKSYYRFSYDNLKLGLTLSEAKRLGYNQCNQNQFYTICSSAKLKYPDLANYPVRFALTQFDNSGQLVKLHLYFVKLPNYKDILTAFPGETIGNNPASQMVGLAGSHEELRLIPSESSLQIFDYAVVESYAHWINRQKLLNSTAIP